MGAINWLAVALASIAGFVVGGVWYGPLFGKTWKQETGKECTAGAKGPSTRSLLITYVLGLAAALMMGHMFARAGTTRTHIFMMMSAGLALFFVIPALWTTYLHQGKSVRLAFIDAGFWLAFYMTMGAVFAILG